MVYDDQYINSFDDPYYQYLDEQEQKKKLDIKNLDKKYEKYKIPFNATWKDGKFHKTLTVEIYGSGQQGARIRNAVTGMSCSDSVGSSSEDLYFKVIDSTARHGRNYPLILFYDTPEQYENHQFVKVGTNVKEVWYEKCLAARKRLLK
jgi:hypothetical protein